MTITELALLRLLPPTLADDAPLRSKLSHAKAVMENYTGNRFYYLQQVEDPSLLYIVGEWESLDQHMNDFIPSAENQALLESLKDDLTVDWLIHFDSSPSALPISESKSPDLRVFSVNRHFVKEGEKDGFQETFDTNRHYLQDFITEGTIGGGWRVDKEEGKEEFILFSPWTAVDQHFAFAKTDGFTKYGKIKDFIDGAEIKHAKLLEL